MGLSQSVSRLHTITEAYESENSSDSKDESCSIEREPQVCINEPKMLELEKLKLEEAKLTDEKKLRYLQQERAEYGRSVKDIKHLIRQAQKLDLLFLIDATGSMKPYFLFVKKRISALSEGISLSYPQCKLRFALTIYRDYGDSKAGAIGCNFTESYKGPDSEFLHALSRIQCRSGGDFAEDVFSGLESAANLDWQATNRLLVHIGDAPCHGRQFHDLPAEGDHYPAGDKLGRNIRTILQNLRESCKITRYCFCHLTVHTVKMVAEFRKAAGEDNWVEEWQFTDMDQLLEKIVAVSRSTIASSLSVVQKGGEGDHDQNYVKVHVVGEIPSWNSIAAEGGVMYIHQHSSSIYQLLHTIRNHRPLTMTTFNDVQVQIAPHPFSGDGTVRWPYYAVVTPKKHGRPLHHLTKTVVVKRFKAQMGQSNQQVHARERYVNQMEAQTVAEHMAEEFNQCTAHLPGVMKIQFTKVCLLQLKGRLYTMEKRLQGEWVRYSNNGQYVNMEDYATTLPAFSHWTYYISDGLLMVTDLQGVKLEDEKHPGKHVYCLCDPAIHTNDKNVLRFTGTNLGERGFRFFLDNHKCNNVCRHLGLPVGMAGHTY